MTTPQIATILDDGTYGQRDMTADEIAERDEQATDTAKIDRINFPDPPT